MLARPPECIGCPIEGEGFSRPEGKCSNRVLMVGEALGEQELREGLPFRPHAPAGGVLERAITRLGYAREQFGIWNVVACRPKNNWLDGAPWEQGAIAHCQIHFRKVVEQFAPKCLLALGNVPLRTLTGLSGKKLSISDLRGYVLQSPLYDLPVVATYHPSFLRRAKDRDEEGMKTGSGAGQAGMHLLGVFYLDIMRAVQVARQGFSYPQPEYLTHPSLHDAWSLYYRLLENQSMLVSADIETPDSGDLDEEDLIGAGSHISMIQFSTQPGWGIAFPFEDEYKEIARKILALPNPKCGHNWWDFDLPRLKAIGFESNGVNHDTLEMWKRWQPDLPAGLQFAAGFVGFPFPWKHLVGSQFEYYGCCDVDATIRLALALPEKMKQKGCWRSYERHTIRVDPILIRMSERGIKVNEEKREAFGGQLQEMISGLHKEIQNLIPEEVKPLHPKEGYKKPPEEAEEGKATTVTCKCKKDGQAKEGCPVCGGTGESPAIWTAKGTVHLEKKEKCPSCGGKKKLVSECQECSQTGKVIREWDAPKWFKALPWNPGSSDQILDYIKFKREEEIRHKMARGLTEEAAIRLAKHKVPTERRTEKETTGKLALTKLAKATKDPIYQKILDLRVPQKIYSTYVMGYAPSPDGKVHTTFGHGTGTGQLTSRRPNVQNIPKHGELAKGFREMIEPSPGNYLVEIDFKSAHALTLGFEAQDPDYMRMARIDMHSFLAAAGLLRLKPASQLIAMPDQELKAYFKWLRKNYTDPKSGLAFEFIRNKRAKPAILGYGFAMGPGTLYENNTDAFANVMEAKRVIETLDGLFDKQPKFRAHIRGLAARQTYLLSLHGAIRWFFDVGYTDKNGKWVQGNDAESCIAFLPANDAFGHIKDAMIRIAENGWDEDYGMMNQIHDALLFDLPKKYVDIAIPLLKSEMEKKSEILINPVAPDGLWIEASVSIGKSNWQKMEEIDVTTGWSMRDAA